MTETLRIAFYTDTYLPAVDGVVTSIINSKEELERRGHEVYVFTSGESRTKLVSNLGKNVFAVHGVKFKKYPQYRLALFPLLTSVKLTEIKPDLIHAHTPFMMGISALLMAKSNRIPIAGTFHTFFTNKKVLNAYGTDSEIWRRMMIRSAWPYARFFYNKCNKVIAPSEVTKNILNRHRINNTVVVPNSVDTKRFNPNVDGRAIRRGIAKNKNERIVLYVGRMSDEKSIDVILKAARMLKDENIKFVFAGTGPSLHKYQQLAAKYGIREKVYFTGFVDSSDLPKYYAASDLFCTASTFETQGVVLLEAMASGKPVVGADYLAIKDIIKNGKNGEKFRPGDSNSCAKKIERVINNISSYNGIENSINKYSLKNTTDILLDVYKQIITGYTSS